MTVQNVEPTGAREAVLAPLLRSVLKTLLKPAFSPRWSIAAQRRWLGGVVKLNLPPVGVLMTWARPARLATTAQPLSCRANGSSRVLAAPGAAPCCTCMAAPIAWVALRPPADHRPAGAGYRHGGVGA